jgi:hypothetical protein
MAKTNKPPRRKTSALQKALMKRPYDFKPPPPQRVEVGGGTTTVKLAYCPIISRYCGDVDCGRCEHLEERLQDTMPQHIWVCSVCAEEVSLVESYWHDGRCDLCGFESCVLVLAKP